MTLNKISRINNNTPAFLGDLSTHIFHTFYTNNLWQMSKLHILDTSELVSTLRPAMCILRRYRSLVYKFMTFR